MSTKTTGAAVATCLGGTGLFDRSVGSRYNCGRLHNIRSIEKATINLSSTPL